VGVDTRNKRASVLGFARGMIAPVWPNPDGALNNEPDREHITYGYPGILAAGASTFIGRLPLLGAGCWLLGLMWRGL